VNPTQRPDGFPEESPHHGYQGDRATPPPGPSVPAGLTIAVSREAGARGGTIGRRVGRKLGWQVYDQELLEYLVQASNVQQNLTDSLVGEAAQWVNERMRDLLTSGRLEDNPASVNLARLSLTLGVQGQVVLIGRGAGFLLPADTTLHARLIAPLEDRVAYLSQALRLTLDEARQRVEVRDARRAGYLSSYLHRSPDQVHAYDLVLNTSSLGEELSAELIIHAARAKAGLRFPSSEGSPDGPPPGSHTSLP
jgi:cytidylate kinase